MPRKANTTTPQPDLTERFTAYLRTCGKRVTAERQAIARCVEVCEGHFTADELQQRLEAGDGFHVSMPTVYSSLRMMCEAGMVHAHHFSPTGAGVYERAPMAKAGKPVNHSHLVCRRCGRVREVHDDELASIIASRRFAGWPVAFFDLYVYALCPKCRRKGLRNS